MYRPVQFSIYEQLLRRIVERFQGGLVIKAHRLVSHSTLGSRVSNMMVARMPSGTAVRMKPWLGGRGRNV